MSVSIQPTPRDLIENGLSALDALQRLVGIAGDDLGSVGGDPLSDLLGIVAGQLRQGHERQQAEIQEAAEERRAARFSTRAPR